jgi:hypothetical protein
VSHAEVEFADRKQRARSYDGADERVEPAGWRRKEWVTQERRLLRVLDQRLFESPAELATAIPKTLIEPFTTADLATSLSIPRWLAQKMAYCLREMGAIQAVGKNGHAKGPG